MYKTDYLALIQSRLDRMTAWEKVKLVVIVYAKSMRIVVPARNVLLCAAGIALGGIAAGADITPRTIEPILAIAVCVWLIRELGAKPI